MPSDVHARGHVTSEWNVTCRTVSPATSNSKTFIPPSRSDENAIFVPSAFMTGHESADGPDPRRRATPPVTSAIQRWSFHSNAKTLPSPLTLGFDPR